MNVLATNGPILMVAAAVVALVVSTALVAVGQVVFRMMGLAMRAALLMAAVRLLVFLGPVLLILVLVFAAYLRR
jgi:hypothetical protein